MKLKFTLYRQAEQLSEYHEITDWFTPEDFYMELLKKAGTKRSNIENNLVRVIHEEKYYAFDCTVLTSHSAYKYIIHRDKIDTPLELFSQELIKLDTEEVIHPLLKNKSESDDVYHLMRGGELSHIYKYISDETKEKLVKKLDWTGKSSVYMIHELYMFIKNHLEKNSLEYIPDLYLKVWNISQDIGMDLENPTQKEIDIVNLNIFS